MFGRGTKKKIYRVVVEDENGSAVLEEEYYSDEDERTAAIDALEHVLSRHKCTTRKSRDLEVSPFGFGPDDDDDEDMTL